MSTNAPVDAISPIEAARAAFDHTKRQLFPLRFGYWLALGFLAFLDQCGRAGGGGGGGGGNGHFGAGKGHGPDLSEVTPWLERAGEWVAAHAPFVAIGAVVGLLLLAALTAVVLWLNARGVFMYLDVVVRGRAEIGRAWQRHGAAAQSYFGWSFAITFAALAIVLLTIGLVAYGVYGLVTDRLGSTAVVFVPIVALLLLGLVVLFFARLALRDFVAPLQIVTGLSCGASARVLEALVLAHPGAFVLYLLLKLVLVVVTGVAVLIGGLLTCCIGFLPVVMQTLFQPFFFFERALPVMLLRQMGYDVAASLEA